MAFLGFVQEKISGKANLIFLPLFYFCMVNWVALHALIKNLFGKDENVWDKVR